MSQNRFLTFGTTAELAREETLQEIRNTIDNGIEVNASNTTIVDVDTGGAQTNPLDVNVVSLPATGSTVDIVAVNGNVITGSTVPTTLNEINGTAITGASVPSNVNQFGGSPIQEYVPGVPLIGAILTDSIASNVNVNLDSLNSNEPIGANQGTSSTSVLRVVNVNDQHHDNAASVPVLPRKNYPYIWHQDFSGELGNANANFRFINGPRGTNINQVFTNPTNGTFGNFFLPTAAAVMEIVSTSINDAVGGTGAQTLVLETFDTPTQETPNQLIILMNGTTPVVIANTYRIRNIFVASTGVTGWNEGTITIRDNATSTLTYPGLMGPYTNGWNSAAIYCPRYVTSPYQNSIVRGLTCFDYVNYNIDNTGGDVETLRIYSRQATSSVWRKQVEFEFNSDNIVALNLSNVQLPSSSAYDFIWTIARPSGTSTTYITGGVGIHIE